jgi:hypothetical protein
MIIERKVGKSLSLEEIKVRLVLITNGFSFGRLYKCQLILKKIIGALFL